MLYSLDHDDKGATTERACGGRVALITGASRGIGKAIALRLAAEGAAVAICSRPRAGFADLGTLEAARQEIASLGADVLAVPFDLSKPDLDRSELVECVESELGPIDILVNNAAAGGFRSFLEWSDAQMAAVLELNFWAPWHLIRKVLPEMRDRCEGWILNISSQTAEGPTGPPFPSTQPSTKGTMYGGSKAFLNRWTQSLAAEVYVDGIAVNALAPQAAAATEVLVKHSNLATELYEPLETMAEAALALCTGDPEMLTGQVVLSLELLADLGRPVYDLTGTTLVPDWQPEHLAPRIETMTKHARGKISLGSSNVGAPRDRATDNSAPVHSASATKQHRAHTRSRGSP
jgi:NAD(P)-dependent dehydrogenase (short-subunit alcohol dehydrogenase family)